MIQSRRTKHEENGITYCTQQPTKSKQKSIALLTVYLVAINPHIIHP